MLSYLRVGVIASVAALALSACGQSGSNQSATGGLPQTQSRGQALLQSQSAEVSPLGSLSPSAHHACDAIARPGHATCFAIVRDDVKSNTFGPDGNPAGYGPADLYSAYNFNPTGGSGVTVAIVDAYDNPNLESDLQTYRAQYGLPVCSTGCFTKSDQEGGQNYPQGDTGWGLEESLDVDMVSANCPKCNILVVEANSSSYSDLGASVAEAVTLGAAAVSNSYGGGEFSGEDTDSPWDQPVPIFASAGDSGYGPEYPAASEYTIAVGGTTLRKGGPPRDWTETVWSGTGSGCAKYANKPAWQTDKGCSKRTETDISYVADPNTGVALYDTYGYGGWVEVGGTSVSSPSITSMFAAAGNIGSIENAGWIWNKKHHNKKKYMNDITEGQNGGCNPKYAYLCRGEKGYDGPTGWGTPNGLGGL